jgi:hypothetical protein
MASSGMLRRVALISTRIGELGTRPAVTSSRRSVRREQTNNQPVWPLVRKRTIPTERPLLVGAF